MSARLAGGVRNTNTTGDQDVTGRRVSELCVPSPLPLLYAISFRPPSPHLSLSLPVRARRREHKHNRRRRCYEASAAEGFFSEGQGCVCVSHLPFPSFTPSPIALPLPITHRLFLSSLAPFLPSFDIPLEVTSAPPSARLECDSWKARAAPRPRVPLAAFSHTPSCLHVGLTLPLSGNDHRKAPFQSVVWKEEAAQWPAAEGLCSPAASRGSAAARPTIHTPAYNYREIGEALSSRSLPLNDYREEKSLFPKTDLSGHWSPLCRQMAHLSGLVCCGGHREACCRTAHRS